MFGMSGLFELAFDGINIIPVAILLTVDSVTSHLCVLISKNSTLSVVLVRSPFHPPLTTTPALPLRVTGVQPWLDLAWCMGGTLYQVLLDSTSFMADTSSPCPPTTITWGPSSPLVT